MGAGSGFLLISCTVSFIATQEYLNSRNCLHSDLENYLFSIMAEMDTKTIYNGGIEMVIIIISLQQWVEIATEFGLL